MKESVRSASAALNDAVMPVVRGLEAQNRRGAEYTVQVVTELSAQLQQIGVGAGEQQRMIHDGQECFGAMAQRGDNPWRRSPGRPTCWRSTPRS